MRINETPRQEWGRINSFFFFPASHSYFWPDGEQADQEIWPGEGVFFGLSTVIKFPANYSESPFSVIGSGVTCLPQRVSVSCSLGCGSDCGIGTRDNAAVS